MASIIAIPRLDIRDVRDFAESYIVKKLDGIERKQRNRKDDDDDEQQQQECIAPLTKSISSSSSDTSLSTAATRTTGVSVTLSPSNANTINKSETDNANIADPTASDDVFKQKVEESKIIKVLGAAIGNMLQDKVDEDTMSSLFCCKAAPKISLFAYIERIVLYINSWVDAKGKKEEKPYAGMSAGLRALIIAIIYLDRLSQKRRTNGSPIAIVNKMTIHRLMLISMMVATKFAEDAPLCSKYMSKVGGIPTNEINQSELAFVKTLEYELFISEREFSNLCKRLFPLAKNIPL